MRYAVYNVLSSKWWCGESWQMTLGKPGGKQPCESWSDDVSMAVTFLHRHDAAGEARTINGGKGLRVEQVI